MSCDIGEVTESLENEVKHTHVHPTSVTETSKEEQRSVVLFVTAERVGGWEIVASFTFYDEYSMSCSRVLEWHKRFFEERVTARRCSTSSLQPRTLPKRCSIFLES